MIALTQTDHSSTGELFDKAIAVAAHHGFKPLDDALTEYPTQKKTPLGKGIDYAHSFEKRLAPLAREWAARKVHEHKKPLYAYSADVKKGAKSKSANFEMHIVGTTSAIAEASLITTTMGFLRDIGLGDAVVHINSIGTRENSERYIRDATNYLRRNGTDLPGALQDELRTHPMRALTKIAQKFPELISSAPNAIDFLNEDGRSQLWEVLEHLDSAEIPFSLTPTVLGSRDCWMHTLFEIRTAPDEDGNSEVLAVGGRYDELPRRAHGSAVPATGVIMEFEVKGRSAPKKPKKVAPQFYFAHLGVEAKLRSLPLLESLRRAEIPVSHCIAHDRIGDQLSVAEHYKHPYTIIMGHKEALESAAIVRDMLNESQETVAIADLPKYLLKLSA